jgi:multiple sugar transport system permease protein
MATEITAKRPIGTQAKTVSWYQTARGRRVIESYIMLTPFLLVFGVFTIYAMGRSLFLSFTDYNGIKDPVYIGIDNYVRLLTGDVRFNKAVQNSLYYVVGVVALNTLFGLFLAMVLRGEGMFKRVMRTLFFLPAVTSGIALAALWRYIFSAESFGLANALLANFGIEKIAFFADPTWPIRVLITMAVWGGMGGTMIIFLAGLNAIPISFYEAAAIDGASPWQQFRYITLPMLRPVTLYIVITGMIGAFQIFDVAYILFNSTENVGGILDSALFIVPYLFYRGFGRFHLGYASAIAWVVFALIFVLTVINLRIGRADESSM